MIYENILTIKLSRRELFKLGLTSAAAAAALPLISGCTTKPQYEGLASSIRTGNEEGTLTGNLGLQELVRQASLAASGHNTQPWKFTIAGQAISITPDYLRRLAVVDPSDRELWISLGCAYEALIIAAHAAGYETDESLFPDQGEELRLTLKPAAAPAQANLAAMIPVRQCTRAAFDGQPLEAHVQAGLLASLPSGQADARLVTDQTVITQAVELIQSGDLAQFGSQTFVDELVTWMRFNESEAIRTRDGLYSACSGNPKMPRWIGKLVLTTGYAAKQAEADARLVSASSGLMLVTTEGDTKMDWVRAGRAYQRLALQLTGLGLRHSFMNQPIEVAELRSAIADVFSASGRTAQLLLRIGKAEAMPYSLRRPVSEVVSGG